jgi:hypothetical protein
MERKVIKEGKCFLIIVGEYPLINILTAEIAFIFCRFTALFI